MASLVPILPFLRPLSLPRPSTIQHFLRFSTTTRCQLPRPPTDTKAAPRPARQTQQYTPSHNEDPNLVASRTASPTYPPPSMKSLPRPKLSRASRRTSQPPKQRPYPTRQPSHHQPAPPKLIPEPVAPLPPAECAPNLAYFVTRTRNNELPVYHDSKRGGNMKLTLVRKIDGEVEVLRDQLRARLHLKKEDCIVNPITRQVVMKGHWKPEVANFLRERQF
ncbi:mitochondrial large subunit ribosomal protein-domain-containing protein [Neohortaea acidophila]|uniref:Large ribosomal subunit protein mL49 n=1 Tax=Neohortaea acidophila TaxID=245834 RepID=A0A6A6PPD0_9PEZI|nr:mitochondrial large subunit ribosomal protein-domain-containing protein [Neohortaea acidophila]KAF2481939.1 mitochondrial large subunit ribosomal protein-domain-containing protein [Neohortaea acidophila]